MINVMVVLEVQIMSNELLSTLLKLMLELKDTEIIKESF